MSDMLRDRILTKIAEHETLIQESRKRERNMELTERQRYAASEAKRAHQAIVTTLLELLNGSNP